MAERNEVQAIMRVTVNTELFTERFLEVYQSPIDIFSDFDADIADYSDCYLSDNGYSVLTEAELAEQNLAGENPAFVKKSLCMICITFNV